MGILVNAQPPERGVGSGSYFQGLFGDNDAELFQALLGRQEFSYMLFVARRSSAQIDPYSPVFGSSAFLEFLKDQVGQVFAGEADLTSLGNVFSGRVEEFGSRF